MAMVINSNIQSLNAQRNLMISQGDQSQAMERLTSGKRINSAGDDAAGLSIANRMTSQVRGLDQAIRNANDGISLIQTAEGALDETTNILQRMRELSIQSANGTYDEGNRGTLNAEVQQLISEIDRISETTKFNGLQILDGTLGDVDLQAGADAYETISLSIGATDSKSLGSGTTGQLMGSEITEASISMAAGDVKINGKDVGAYDGSTQNLDELISELNEVSGISASTYVEETATNKGSGVLVDGTDVLTITATGLDGQTQAYAITDTDNMDELVAKINDATGGVVAASTDDQGRLVLSSDSSASLSFTENAAVTAATGDLSGSAVQARLMLSSDDGEPITIEGTKTRLDALGFNERSTAGEIEGNDIDTNAFQAGDLTINGVEIGASTTGSLADKISAINEADAGVTATAFSSLDFLAVGAGTNTHTELNINGTAITVADPTADGYTLAELTTIQGQINAETTETGVAAYIQGDTLVLEADGIIKVGTETGAAEALTAMGNDDEEDNLGIKLTSDDGSEISIQMSETRLSQAKAASGFLETNQSEANSIGGSVANIDISTADGAQKAIGIIDNALEEINSTRGDLGAINNRLDFTINNLSNVSENVAAARSRIEDADFAKESAALSRAQVLQQAGTAMLAQANAAPQQVLSLLQ